jgi:large subunit ribosomal protein L25
MRRVALKTDIRKATGKGVARKLRATGMIPAVLYGQEKSPVSLSLSARELVMTLRAGEGHHLLVDLTVNGEEDQNTLAMLQEIKLHPVHQTLLHADFMRIDSNKPIRTTVPIHVTGQPVGVRLGGVHQQILREVEVEAIPDKIPAHINVDISSLAIGQSLHVQDLEICEDYTILTEKERAISSVLAPKLMAEGGASASAAEPAAAKEA